MRPGLLGGPGYGMGEIRPGCPPGPKTGAPGGPGRGWFGNSASKHVQGPSDHVRGYSSTTSAVSLLRLTVHARL